MVLLQVQTSTAKPVYKDHSRDQQITVSIDRWSLCSGPTVLISSSWTCPEWSLQADGPSIQVVFKIGFNVLHLPYMYSMDRHSKYSTYVFCTVNKWNLYIKTTQGTE